jgi:uncharacterized OB-fold protein
VTTVLDALVDVTSEVVTLRASRCPACTRVEFPALTTCPACGSAAVSVTLGPTASIAGFTEVLHAPPGAEVDVPYTIAVAAFGDANLAVMGLLDQHVPCTELAIGDPLTVCVVATRTGSTYGFRVG